MRLVLRYAAAFLLCLCSIPSWAQKSDQEPGLGEIYKQYLSLYEQERYREAEQAAKAYLSLAQKLQGPEGIDVAWGCNNLGLVYRNLGRFPEALPLFRRASTIMEKALGPDHLDTSRVLKNYAWALVWMAQASEAERVLRRVLAIREGQLGRGHIATADVIGDLATAVKSQGRYAEALTLEREALQKIETAAPGSGGHAARLNNIGTLLTEMGQYRQANGYLERALAIGEKLGNQGQNGDAARTLDNLAWLRLRQGQYRAAEGLFRRSYEIRALIGGASSTWAIESLADLTVLFSAQARFAEAESNYETIIEQRVRLFGSESLSVATALNNRGTLFFKQGRYGEAEADLTKSLAIREKLLGKRHPDVAATMSSLGWMRYLQGQYPEAEALLRQATTVREQTLGRDHYDVGDGLSDLAIVYAAEGRYEEAEPLRKRFIEIARKAYGERSVGAATALALLANYYRDVDRLPEAIAAAERALDARRELLDPVHPDIAASLETLGELATRQGRLDDADRLLTEAEKIDREAYGGMHPVLADVGLKLGRLQLEQQRYDAAGTTLIAALAQATRTLEPTHPRIAAIHDALAQRHQAVGAFDEALAASERFAEIRRKRLEANVEELAGGIVSENRLARPGFIRLIDSADHLMKVAPDSKLFAQAFEAAQLLRADSTAGALARTAARFATDGSPLASLIRERIRLLDQWRSTDRRIAAAEDPSSPARLRQSLAILRTKLSDTASQIAVLDKRLAKEYPDYIELVRPQVLAPARAVELLGKDEALIVLAVGDTASFSFALGPGGAKLHRAEIGSERVRELVSSVRSAIEAPFTLPDLIARGYDSEAAFKLYRELIAPLEPAIAGASHIILVPDDALQSLPFAMLLTAQPNLVLKEFADYREAPWLGRRYAFSTLPSVSSLQALRGLARASRATQPFAGIGDPVLHDNARSAERRRTATLFRGRTADVEALRQLSSLPESAAELRTIAGILGANDNAILLGQRATEANVRRMKLDNSKVVMFATHGLLASETAQFGTAAEPALVLTPPKIPTEEDDGLLTASEIVRSLKLDADWVILSACNTAGPERDGAEGLSGLAKAFFYAGTRALLVSHWSVPTESTPLLTSTAFAALAREPGIGRAEAVRRSMLALMTRADHLYFAHPVFWAPFVVVGEGGAGR